MKQDYNAAQPQPKITTLDPFFARRGLRGGSSFAPLRWAELLLPGLYSVCPSGFTSKRKALSLNSMTLHSMRGVREGGQPFSFTPT